MDSNSTNMLNNLNIKLESKDSKIRALSKPKSIRKVTNSEIKSKEQSKKNLMNIHPETNLEYYYLLKSKNTTNKFSKPASKNMPNFDFKLDEGLIIDAFRSKKEIKRPMFQSNYQVNNSSDDRLTANQLNDNNITINNINNNIDSNINNNVDNNMDNKIYNNIDSNTNNNVVNNNLDNVENNINNNIKNNNINSNSINLINNNNDLINNNLNSNSNPDFEYSSSSKKDDNEDYYYNKPDINTNFLKFNNDIFSLDYEKKNLKFPDCSEKMNFADMFYEENIYSSNGDNPAPNTLDYSLDVNLNNNDITNICNFNAKFREVDFQSFVPYK